MLQSRNIVTNDLSSAYCEDLGKYEVSNVFYKWQDSGTFELRVLSKCRASSSALGSLIDHPCSPMGLTKTTLRRRWRVTGHVAHPDLDVARSVIGNWPIDRRAQAVGFWSVGRVSETRRWLIRRARNYTLHSSRRWSRNFVPHYFRNAFNVKYSLARIFFLSQCHAKFAFAPLSRVENYDIEFCPNVRYL